MAITQIPTFTDSGNYEISIDLDGVVYLLVFTYNPRDSHWYVSFQNEAGTEIRSGLKLVTGVGLLFRWRAEGRPLGELYMIDPSGADREVGFEAIGRDVFLTYVDRASLLELTA